MDRCDEKDMQFKTVKIDKLQLRSKNNVKQLHG